MKSLLIFLVLFVASGCQTTGSWGYGGLNYDVGSNSFSGMSPTSISQMPTAGSANFNGEYRSRTFDNLFGKGNAILGVNFGSRAVQLALSGDLNGTSNGFIVNSGFRGSSTFDFLGQFFGSGATAAAGFFSGSSGGNPASGEFIVTR